MNVKKNTLYQVNLGAFILIAAYSLLINLNALDFANIDMNAGLCAVVVIMVIALLMYIVQATRLATILYANSIAKITVEIVSTVILITLAYVIRIYCVDSVTLYMAKEAVVVAIMFMSYLIARMLNQFGFITLLVLAPWPYMLNTYNLEMSQLIVLAEMIGVLMVISVILYMVRQQRKLKGALMSIFVVAVVGMLAFSIKSLGKDIVQVANPFQYLTMFESVLDFNELEKFYFIGVITAAILGGIRMWLGKASGNTLVAFAATASLVTMTVCGLGSEYMFMLYPILAIVASGACGTRPLYLDEEIKLYDTMEEIPAKSKKKNVDISYKDDSDLDKMLDEIDSNKTYTAGSGAPFNPAKFAASQSPADEEIPIELQMYDFGAGAPEPTPELEKKPEKTPEPEKQSEKEEPTPIDVDVVVEEAEESADETVEHVVEEVAVAVAGAAVVNEIVELVDEVSMESEALVAEEVPLAEDVPVAEVTETAAEETAVAEEIATVDVDVAEVPVAEESVVATLAYEEPAFEVPEFETTVVEEMVYEAPVAEAPVFEMPTFEMETAKPVAAEVMEEIPATMEATLEAVVEDAVADDVSVVVTDENVASISSTEGFSMPTFEMDSAVESVSSMFAEPAVETVEPVVETVETVVEEVKEGIIVTAEDAGSIAGTEEFSMPGFEMSSMSEATSVIEEMTTTEVAEPVAEVVAAVEEVAEEPVVLVENPIFIKNPINFNRTRSYDAPVEEHKNYGFEMSAPTFETMGSFLADNKENAFPEFETAQGAMDDFVSGFVTEEEPVEAIDASVDMAVVDTAVEPVTSAIDSVVADVEETALAVEEVVETGTVADLFEYVEEAESTVESVASIEMPEFMASDFDTADLMSTITGEKVEESFDEPETKEMVVEPESIELGLELGEDFSFGQSESFADWYDYDAEPVPYVFDGPENVAVESLDAEVSVASDVEAFVTEQAAPAPVVEERKVYELADDEEFDVTKDYVFDYSAYIDEEEEEAEVVVAKKDDDLYDWNAADAAMYAYDEEDEKTETVATAKVDDDYFDWSTYDGADLDDEEGSDSKSEETVVSKPKDDLFEEFVWTDEMIKAMDAEMAAEAEEAVDTVKEAVAEVAATVEEYDYSSDEPAQYEVFQSSGNFVPEVEEVKDETQYEVFQSSGNFVPEVEEVKDETQYEVFQSSGNFVPEVEEVKDETQYEVFQSSGNFVPEQEEVVEEVQYKTYGQADPEEDKKAKEVQTKKNEFADFDLDLPDF